MQTLPLTRDLVLIGGGHAHALLLRRWGMAPLPGVRLTLISPEPAAAYSGMLPGHVAGHYPRAALDIDLVRLARHAGARVVLERAEGLDPAAQRVLVPGRPGIAYDVASLDIGITARMPALPGFAAHGVPVKPLDDFATAWEAFAAAAAGPTPVVVIGGGVAGVELALAMTHRLRAAGALPQVTVLEAGPEPMADTAPAARRALLAHLARQGVMLRCSISVARVEAEAVVLEGGERVAAAFTLGAAGARPQEWLRETGLHLTDGFVTVDEMLRSISHAQVFAVGDCAHLSHAPRAKAGVYAVRQAPVLYRNLRAALGGGRMRAYRPQKGFLKLVSTGGKSAVGERFGLVADGAWVWRQKDRIDRRFMAKFAAYPPMPAPALPRAMALGVAGELAEGKPLCGGCGAKVGRQDLRAALAGLPPMLRSDVLSGPGDDAAILRHGDGLQVITTDHLRAFVADPWLLTRITAVHALGDIWAMGGQPQAALAQVILPRMSAAMQAATLAEIMAAAAEVFGAAGADVVGGHTSIGAELTLGFTVTGLVDGAPVGQGGARPGDALILTKPIGSGTLLAAEMQGLAEGAWVAAAWASMARPQGADAAILAPVAGAMTDVTGFGLAGHLLGMLEASGAGARLRLADVPLLAGAEALAAAGLRSTLWPANAQAGARMFRPEGPRADLLFDPQTAGGLLAAVPGAQAARLVAALHDAGAPAAIIGEVVAAEAPWIEVV